MAIDVADETLHTDIRKKYLSLLSQESGKQQAQEENNTQSPSSATPQDIAGNTFISIVKKNKPKGLWRGM